MPEPAQAEQVAALLRATRHLLILDNAESITAAPAAIPHALDPAERDKLKTLLARLRGGRTLVLLGSREAEDLARRRAAAPEHLPAARPGPAGRLRAGRPDPDAATSATGWLNDAAERDALQDLVTLLGGYPLPLTVVLPVLATAPPSRCWPS